MMVPAGVGGGYRVGVLGATGAVGSTILELLASREFPVSEVVPFASPRSVGRTLGWGGTALPIRSLDFKTIQGFDLVLSSAGGAISAEWAPHFVDAGAVVIDNTSYWRMHEAVPLVVAGVNDDAALGHIGIIANPNCTTMALLMVLAPIHRAVGLRRIVVSTYQAVSGTGQRAVDELWSQARSVLAGEPVAPPSVYPHQIAFNVIPQIESFRDGDDYTTEERKVMGESRKILGLGGDLAISVTCARVPVIAGHSESVNVCTRDDLSPSQCRALLAGAPGVRVLDDPGAALYPTPLAAAGIDDVLVGRIRRDPDQDRTLNLWLDGDNLRKGAATNAVQIAELLVDRGLI